MDFAGEVGRQHLAERGAIDAFRPGEFGARRDQQRPAAILP